jgi:putative membrane protein
MIGVVFALAHQGPWWCPMCGPGGMWGWGMVPMTLFWVVVLGIVFWLMLQLVGRGRAPGEKTGRGRAEEILKERYARGEIDRETYQRMLEDLSRNSELHLSSGLGDAAAVDRLAVRPLGPQGPHHRRHAAVGRGVCHHRARPGILASDLGFRAPRCRHRDGLPHAACRRRRRGAPALAGLGSGRLPSLA